MKVCFPKTGLRCSFICWCDFSLKVSFIPALR